VNTPPLLRRGGFRTLLVGQSVSALGDWMICALAVQRLPQLRRHVAAALDIGVKPRAIVVVFRYFNRLGPSAPLPIRGR